jgi:hypothetical protein
MRRPTVCCRAGAARASAFTGASGIHPAGLVWAAVVEHGLFDAKDRIAANGK